MHFRFWGRTIPLKLSKQVLAVSKESTDIIVKKIAYILYKYDICGNLFLQQTEKYSYMKDHLCQPLCFTKLELVPAPPHHPKHLVP